MSRLLSDEEIENGWSAIFSYPSGIACIRKLALDELLKAQDAKTLKEVANWQYGKCPHYPNKCRAYCNHCQDVLLKAQEQGKMPGEESEKRGEE